MLPVGTAASTSPSLANVPPATATVALARFWLSGSDTETFDDSVTDDPFSVKLALVATLTRVGGLFTAVMSIVVVALVLLAPPKAVPLGSTAVHVMVRV